jgi:hypothetical protein
LENLKGKAKKAAKWAYADLEKTREKAARDYAKSRAADATYSQNLQKHRRRIGADRWQSSRTCYNKPNK